MKKVIKCLIMKIMIICRVVLSHSKQQRQRVLCMCSRLHAASGHGTSSDLVFLLQDGVMLAGHIGTILEILEGTIALPAMTEEPWVNQSWLLTFHQDRGTPRISIPIKPSHLQDKIPKYDVKSGASERGQQVFFFSVDGSELSFGHNSREFQCQ
jgi:hypothetical protein